MHPEDVAAYVADCVDVLGEKLADRPDLAGAPVLEGVALYVPFKKVDRPLVEHPVDTGLLHAGGQGMSVVHRVPLLGQAPVTRDLLLYMDLTDFDAQPPTAELMLPDRTPLPAGEWPKSILGQGIVPNHKDYGRPFFCRRGLREYHSHPQHEDVPWDKHRESLALHQIVFELLEGLHHTWIGR